MKKRKHFFQCLFWNSFEFKGELLEREFLDSLLFSRLHLTRSAKGNKGFLSFLTVLLLVVLFLLLSFLHFKKSAAGLLLFSFFFQRCCFFFGFSVFSHTQKKKEKEDQRRLSTSFLSVPQSISANKREEESADTHSSTLFAGKLPQSRGIVPHSVAVWRDSAAE